MSTGKVVLIVFGGLMEFGGIVLLGFPDFVPGALRLSSWLRVHSHSVANRLRRLVGLPPGQTFVSISAAGEANAAMRLSITRAIKADATIEEQLAFLLQRDQEAQANANALAARLSDLETERARQLDRLRDRLETHLAAELAGAKAAYRPLRVGGTIALAIGLVSVTTANFV